METKGHITNETFEKHMVEDMENFQKLRLQNDQIEQERRKRHEEVMAEIAEIRKMILPVFEAFTFKKQLDQKMIGGVVRWSKILGFVTLIIALCGTAWEVFKFGVHNIPR